MFTGIKGDIFGSQGRQQSVLWRAKRKPAQTHETPRIDAHERIYAVGDIHGRHDLLDTLFEKIVEDFYETPDDRQMKIIFLGDYVDRGDHSKDVLDRLVLIKERLPDQTAFLAGNHEAVLLGFLRDPVKNSNWLEFGGRQTLGSYGVAPPQTLDDHTLLQRTRDAFLNAIEPHLSFLGGLERYVRSGDVVFVHAGLDPSKSLDQQSDEALLWGNSEFLDNGGYPDLRVVHGHYDANEPVMTPHRVCVDTGAYYSGRLTAIRLDSEEELIIANAIEGY